MAASPQFIMAIAGLAISIIYTGRHIYIKMALLPPAKEKRRLG